MQDLAGKIAVITGAGDGMGRAMALAFAARGMHVVAADIDEARLAKVAQEIKALGVDVLVQRTDVAERDQVKMLADAAYTRFGVVNLLVNNAGVVGSLATRLRDLDLRAWDWVLDINTKGVIYGIHYFLARMLDSGAPGHIVNTASMAGLSSGLGGGAYTASKHAVVAISRTLRAETEGTNLGVSVLCPSFVHTNLVHNTSALVAGRNDMPADRRAAGIDSGAMDRLQQMIESGIAPELVADMVVDSVEANRFYIVTHPGSAEGLEENVWAQIRADHADLQTRFAHRLPQADAAGD